MTHNNNKLTALISLSLMSTWTVVYAQEVSTSSADQSALNLTIYNSNVALIKDKREITLPQGQQTLAFKDVSAMIKPETAILSGDMTLLEQNFEYDLLTPQTLLNKFIGKEVTLERYQTPDSFVTEKATVLSNNNGTVLKIGDEIRTGYGAANLIFNDVPDDLREKPTLTMLVDNQSTAPQPVELTYLSDGLNWKADYVASLNDDDTLNLAGWVTLTNQSGTSYHNANLQLVAGEVNRAPQTTAALDSRGSYASERLVKSSAPMQEESLFEYHLYTLDRPTDIKNNQQKQVSLLQASDIPYKKRLQILAKDRYGWRAWAPNSEYTDLTVDAQIIVDNKKVDNLGMPLPAGIVRTYQNDSQGNMQFIGEDRVKHTPENESVTLKLGESFDVTAKRKQTDFNQGQVATQNAVGSLNHNLITATYEVIFKNAKETASTIEYVETFRGNWTVTQQSLGSEKRSSTRNQWNVNIPAKGETVLTYTVEMTY